MIESLRFLHETRNMKGQMSPEVIILIVIILLVIVYTILTSGK